MDASMGDDEIESRIEEVLGTLEITKIVSPKKAVARVVVVLAEMETGNLVKLGQE